MRRPVAADVDDWVHCVRRARAGIANAGDGRRRRALLSLNSTPIRRVRNRG